MELIKIWNSQPLSEKLAGVTIAVFFPIVFAAIAVIS